MSIGTLSLICWGGLDLYLDGDSGLENAYLLLLLQFLLMDLLLTFSRLRKD